MLDHDPLLGISLKLEAVSARVWLPPARQRSAIRHGGHRLGQGADCEIRIRRRREIRRDLDASRLITLNPASV